MMKVGAGRGGTRWLDCFEGKSALITGGGGGIGRATAPAFAREGARLAVADLIEEAARETVALVNAAGGQAISLAGDVTRDADVQSMTEAVVSTYGRLDCAFTMPGSPAGRSTRPARRPRNGPRKRSIG